MQLEDCPQLHTYETLLRKWNDKINLVSKTTIADIRARHFADCAQLIDFYEFQHGDTVVDIGSGAGFPGLVLAMLRSDLNVILVESDTRKCSFLRTVSRETKVPVQIYNDRIENVLNGGLYADVVTARALADLSRIFEYTHGLFALNEVCTGLFMKGQLAADEIEHAEAEWLFEKKLHPSATSENAYVLEVSHLRRKERHCA